MNTSEDELFSGASVLPVSVQIITLNEEGFIGDCLRSVIRNSPAEILVIDGGSSDNTVEIAHGLGAEVLAAEGLGRGGSRRLGYLSTSLPYVAMVDADDRLPNGWIKQMLDRLEAGGYSALQGSLRATSEQGFFQSGWNQYLMEASRPTADSRMVGHPSVFAAECLVPSRSDIGHEHEDTQLSIDFEQRGLRQGIVDVVSFRIVPTSWRESSEKWRGYGRGYRDLLVVHPNKRAAMAYHLMIRIPFFRAWRPVHRGKWLQPLFGLLMWSQIARGFIKPQR